MSEPKAAAAGELPSLRGRRAGRVAAIHEQGTRTGGRGKRCDSAGRRGRPSYEDYAGRVCAALRYDLVRLDECMALTQLPGVQELSRRNEQRLLPVGSALRALFDQAVADVTALATAGRDPSLDRIAIFLRIWYTERGTITEVAGALELSRSRVSRAVKPPAVELVTRRFLELASGVRNLVPAGTQGN